jgi:hypothetical protein
MELKSETPTVSRTIILFAFSTMIFIVLFIIWDSDFCYVYRKHIQSNSNLSLDFKDLNSNTIEQEIKFKYPINWYCGFDNSMAEFGNYYCADELKSWNSIPALTVVLWFQNKKLNAMKVDIPFWHHQKMIKVLNEKYGKPTNVRYYKNRLKLLKNLAVLILTKGEYKSDKNILGDEYAEWILPNRTMISTTLEDDANPFSHSTILWRTY